MPRKYLIVLFFMAFAGARHAVPLQGLPLLSDMAFAATQENGQPCPPECVTDSMEIITYYPSPYGYYEELRGDKIIVGDTDNSRIDETHLPPSGTLTFEPKSYAQITTEGTLYEGTVYYDSFDHEFKYYDNNSSWQPLGGGGEYWKPSEALGRSESDIYYNWPGNVGIGVGAGDTLGAKLQVNTGNMSTKGLILKSGVIKGTISPITTFNATGVSQYFVVPARVSSLTITTYGSVGGGAGGKGGMARATFSVTAGETLEVGVGSVGKFGAGTGGGGGDYPGSAGGGASYVRRGGTKIIIAGGGGGGGGAGTPGGNGGGDFGTKNPGGKCDGGGGTSTSGGIADSACSPAGSNGSIDTGGDGAAGCGSLAGGGGGGSGYYGGAGAGGCGSAPGGGGGGGGSGYIDVSGNNSSMQTGVNSGYGKVIIEVNNFTDQLMAWQDANGEAMGVFDVNGHLGIGTATPNYTLTVNGTAWVTSGSWTGSDLRWKKDIEPLPDNTIDRLIKLDTIYYNYNNELFKDMHFPAGRQIGLSAQNVEKQFPELVLTDNDGYKAVAYDKLNAVTIEAIKEQQKEIEQLKEALRGQEEKSRENQDKLRKQQKEIELLKAGKEFRN